MNKNELSDTQIVALRNATEILKGAFPNLSLIEIITRPLLKSELGPLPKYSGLNEYIINKTPLAAVGTSVLCYGIDPITTEKIVLIIDRKETDAAGVHYYGLLGGYVDIVPSCNTSCKEQPLEGAIREAAEESADGNNKSIIQLTPDRLALLNGCINDRTNPPVAIFTYMAELTGREIMAIRKHNLNLKTDEEYRQRTLENNKYEIYGMHLFNIQDAKKLKKDHFRHETTWHSLQIALTEIAKKALCPVSFSHIRHGGTPQLRR